MISAMKNEQLAILMCTYNGERFVGKQLDSFLQQTFPNWELFVFDDGSKDATAGVIERYKQLHTEHGFHFTRNASQKGFARNFLNAISESPGHFDFYALSDQDDIWLPHKLERALKYFQDIPESMPALYGSRTILVDQDENHLGFSHLFKKRPSFSNALVQSIAGGNTLVFNRAARNIIARAGSDLGVISHDWFIYQLISGAGGKIFYDAHPEILYRQHGRNLSGSNRGLLAKVLRISQLLNGTFKAWNNENILALEKNVSLLTAENREKLALFVKARKGFFLRRFWGFFKVGIYRQTLMQNIALYISGIMNRI